ncbi:MAG: hypothetical protein JO019_03650 [Candidatus Kaiserbacteria bacterium]|nr:hypothetical protein [Candidatus Kaiserbacteria bacterium]
MIKREVSLVLAASVLFAMLIVCVALISSAFRDLSAESAAPPEAGTVAVYLNNQEYARESDTLARLVNDQGATAALERLKKDMSDPKVAASCHSLAHGIGHAAFEKYKDFGTAMQYQDDVCGAGYLHGVIERVFKSSTDIDRDMDTICKPYTSEVFLQKCYHGVGHGLMYYTDNDVTKSISMCGEYKSNEFKIACSEGVFMENFGTDENDHESAFLNADNPSFPCTQQNTFYKGSCYFYAPIYYLRLHENNYRSALNWCATIETPFKLRCMTGVGSRIMKQYLDNARVPENMCVRQDRAETAACIDGMMSYYLLQNNSVDAALRICDDFSGPSHDDCVSSVESRRALYEDQ